MAELEMLLKPLSLHFLNASIDRPLAHLRYRNVGKLKATIFCSGSDTGKSISGGVSEPGRKSSRGRTRKSLGLDEAEPSSLTPAQEEPSLLIEREANPNLSFSTKPQDDAATLLQQIKNKRHAQDQGTAPGVKYPEAKSLMDWAQKNRPAAESLEHHIPDKANTKEFSKRIQDLINADINRRYMSDVEDSDENDPLFVEEDDPYWLDEPDEGWGFKVSDLYKEKFGVKEGKKKTEKDDDDNDVSKIPERDWDLQPEKWSAIDVDSMTWVETVFGDPSPLVALLYDRYGKKGRECYHVLRELEEAANRIWDSKRLPPRLVKINVSTEEDLAAAIRIKEVPTLIFMKGGKMIHHQSGYFTADDILRILSYFYYGAARPPCLKNYKPVVRR